MAEERLQKIELSLQKQKRFFCEQCEQVGKFTICTNNLNQLKCLLPVCVSCSNLSEDLYVNKCCHLACRSCSRDCSGCNRQCCQRCYEQCRFCSKAICAECEAESYAYCDCGKVGCLDCVQGCNHCDDLFCPDCRSAHNEEESARNEP